MKLKMMPDEVFLGGAVTDGIRQPYTAASTEELDLTRNETPNQMMPLLLSTTGRWLWNPAGMRVSFQKGEIQCTKAQRWGSVAAGCGKVIWTLCSIASRRMKSNWTIDCLRLQFITPGSN